MYKLCIVLFMKVHYVHLMHCFAVKISIRGHSSDTFSTIEKEEEEKKRMINDSDKTSPFHLERKCLQPTNIAMMG